MSTSLEFLRELAATERRERPSKNDRIAREAIEARVLERSANRDRNTPPIDLVTVLPDGMDNGLPLSPSH